MYFIILDGCFTS